MYITGGGGAAKFCYVCINTGSMKTLRVFLLTGLSGLLFLLSGTLQAQELRMPAIFGDRMVLQRNDHVLLWGEARPGKLVTATTGENSVSTVSGSSGKWQIMLPEMPGGKTFTLTVACWGEVLYFDGVITGDVYYAGGQSNMAYALKRSTGGEQAAAEASFPEIRWITVNRDISLRPCRDIPSGEHEDQSAGWQICSPSTAGDFSAVAFYFAREIHRDRKVPVGIVHVSWGGTDIISHSSPDANRILPYYRHQTDTLGALPDSVHLEIDYQQGTHNYPGVIYNAMIHPLIPYNVSGFIWYQGEQNWNFPFRYREQFKIMIMDWRIRWKQGNLPFMFIQLPNFGESSELPEDHFWPVLRESQACALHLPNTSMAVTLDLGDGDIHPRDKEPMAHRLALAAKNLIYHEDVRYRSPLYKDHTFAGDTVIIRFDNAAEGLTIREGDFVKSLAIAGQDSIFHLAASFIRTDSLFVFNPEVSNPISVRYAWGKNPVVNLYNKEGLPVAPFRTDHWEVGKDGTWGDGE